MQKLLHRLQNLAWRIQKPINYSSDGEHLLTSYVPITDEGGNVVAVLACDYDASTIIAELEDSAMKTMSLTFEGLAISIVIIFFVVRSIMKSLNRVNAKLYDLVNNEGVLTQKLEIKYFSFIDKWIDLFSILERQSRSYI